MKKIGVILFCLLLCTGMRKRIVAPKKDSLSKDHLLVILELINNNNAQFLLASNFSEGITKKFKEYAQLNQQRTRQLYEEDFSPLTIKALIVLNEKISRKYHKLTSQSNKYHQKHSSYLEELRSLPK